ncbi:helix-turn-helix domain-containing protein [Chitinivibrio alkaliphilus]|uniref:XRE family transcriptional regulator n=1 Tax=Chitinivibrio alkaliphilus ACht1 TaxID=1313304 RepID=U7DDI2_9BACT|nr:helix-turn-helix domain-containing protein [Chitinivibrio alkaliphilus]ERP38946.1 XRE family transcriptional regulator [Chitinivibrio alkaliphilus ACht1]
MNTNDTPSFNPNTPPEHSKNEESSKQPKQERVGEILKRERVKRRISIAHIAEDLKINEVYIEALEKSEYQTLPAPPYGRVYIKTIATYLDLDVDRLLKKYADETNNVLPDPQRERQNTITINVQDEKKHSHLLPIAVIFVLVGIFAYILHQQNQEDIEETPDTLQQEPSTPQPEHESYPDPFPQDTEEPAVPAQDDNDTTHTPTADTSNTTDSEALRISLDISSDSTWMQIYADGRRVENGIYYDQTILLEASDSIHINVGNNSAVTYTLNGEPLDLSGQRIRFTRITPEGVTELSRADWNAVFGQ